MTGAELYAAQQAEYKLTQAIRFISEAKDAIAVLETATLENLQLLNAVDALNRMRGELDHLRDQLFEGTQKATS